MLQKILQLFMNQNFKNIQNLWPILMALCFSCLVLISTVITGGFIGYSLLLVWLLISLALYKQGFNKEQLWSMSKKGILTSMTVLQIFFFIGILTALWQASGTMPAIINYSLSIIQPNLFIVFAFLLPAMVSYLIGTSLGTVGTVGLALIIMARAGNVPEDLVAGAIIAGAYVGDRGSPMSSSAALLATLTHTKVPENVPRLFLNGLVALVLSTLIYLGISFFYPLNTVENNLPQLINKAFLISPIMLIPAVIMVILIIAKASMKTALGASSLTAATLAIVYQHYSVQEVITFAITGFQLTGHEELGKIIHGGGIISMLGAAMVVMVACAISSLIEGAGLLEQVNSLLERFKTREQLFRANIFISLLTAAIGCNQSVACVMTYYMMRISYARNKVKDEDMVIDFENTGILLAPLIPWNIAALVPTTMLSTSDTGYIPFAFYLYLVPLIHWLKLKYINKKNLIIDV